MYYSLGFGVNTSLNHCLLVLVTEYMNFPTGRNKDTITFK